MRNSFPLAASLCLLAAPASAAAQDMQVCFSAAEIVRTQGTLSEAEKEKAHAACLQAMSDSSNVVQKYHLQEADWDITGQRPKP